MTPIDFCKGKYFVKDGNKYMVEKAKIVWGGRVQLDCQWFDDPKNTMYRKERLWMTFEEFLETDFK